MRRPLSVLAVVAVAAGITSATASASRGLQLTQVGRLRLPDRGYVVDLPRHAALAPRDVVVRENGEPVEDLRLMPLEQTTTTLGVVLVIDASDSMRGPSFRGALAAARKFVARKNASMKVGLIAFNDRAYVLLKPSADAHAVRSALARPPALAEGTRIYDGVSRALSLLDESHVASGAVVLLSDGADTGSHLSEPGLIEKARRAHIRVFTVGLRSHAFDSSALQALARDTGASYAAARSSDELQKIYDALGKQLAGEYLLEYRSAASRGTRVHVEITIRGLGAAAFAYTAGAPQGLGPFHRSLFERFWSSPASMVFIGLLGMLLAAGAAVALLRRPPAMIVGRLSDYLSIEDRAEEQHRPLLSERLLARTESSLSRTAWWANFQEELEIARISIAPAQIIVGTAVVTVLAAMVLLSIWGPLVIAAACVPLAVRALIKRKLANVRDEFVTQLPDNLQVLASALRAGHSFTGAFAVVAADAPEPARREFQRVVADEQLGVPLEDSLREVARRMESADVEQVALLAELQREAGGNMAEVLDTVVETIRDRFDLRRLVKTLTAQGRMARWILSLLPAFLLLLIGALNPAYMEPLFASSLGRFALLIATGMVIAGSVVIKRIVNIKV
jgi:tight adherence protein B